MTSFPKAPVLIYFLLLILSFSVSGESLGAPAALSELGYFQDTDSEPSSFEDIRSDKIDFLPWEKQPFEFGIQDHPFWVRARIPSLDQGERRPVLTIDSPAIREAELYIPVFHKGALEYRRLQGGLSHDLPEEDWHYRFMIYDLPADTAEGEWVYLHFNAKGHSANFTMALKSPDEVRRTSWMVMAVLFIAIGVLMAMILYNAILFLFLRDNSYLLYVVYILSMLTYQLCHSGVGRIAGWPALMVFAIPVSTLTYIFGMAFAQVFLDLRRTVPVLNRIISVLILISAGAFVVWAVGMTALSNRIVHILGLLVPVVLVTVGVVRIRQGFLSARYYLAAWLVLCLSVMVLVLVGFNVIPYHFLSYNVFVLGSALEAILLSMALGDQVRILQQKQSQLQEDERRLMKLSVTDDLTGLYNKRGYAAKLPLLLRRACEKNGSLSLLMLDVDRFKNFNDSYGHAEGDRVLRELGGMILGSIRDRDVACRYGGEEFAVILPDSPEKDACLIAERLRKSVESRGLVLEDGRTVNCTISIGVASLIEGDDPRSLFVRADEALYMAKENGRNRVVSCGSMVCEVEMPR